MEEEPKAHVLGSMRGVAAVAILAGTLFYVIFALDGRVRVEDTISVASTTPIEILFVGDIMLDRSVRSTMDANGFGKSFERIKFIFDGVNLAVGNLEGTITNNTSLSRKDPKILRFTFSTTTAAELKKLGFTHVSLANNHALDFGLDGLSDTEKNLQGANLYFFGSPNNDRNLISMSLVGEKRVCLVGYHQLFKPSTIPTLKEIESQNVNCDYLVVYAHWGDEYQSAPTPSQVEIGHAFIDAGADLVVGSHPHVIQPVEIYKGRAIFYSLGNFMFDQDFSLPTRQGLAVRLELNSTTEKFHLIGLEMENNVLYFPEKENFQGAFNILTSKLSPVHKALADVDGVLILRRGR